jgi:hypothetical protein
MVDLRPGPMVAETPPQALGMFHDRRIAGVYNVGGGPRFGSGLTIDTAAEQYGKKP